MGGAEFYSFSGLAAKKTAGSAIAFPAKFQQTRGLYSMLEASFARNHCHFFSIINSIEVGDAK